MTRTLEQACYPRDPAGVLVCDICGERVPATENGVIAWNTDADNNVIEFRLTHKGKCDKDHQMPHSSMLDYVTELDWKYVCDMVARYKWPGPELTRLVLIVWAIIAHVDPSWKPEY